MTDQSEIDWAIQGTGEVAAGLGSRTPRDSVTIEKLRREKMDGLSPFKQDNRVQLIKDDDETEESENTDEESDEECNKLMDTVPEFEKMYSELHEALEHQVESYDDELKDEIEKRGKDWINNRLIDLSPELDSMDIGVQTRNSDIEQAIDTILVKKDDCKTPNGATAKGKKRSKGEDGHGDRRVKSEEIHTKDISTPIPHRRTHSKDPPNIRPRPGNSKLPNYVRKPEILKYGQSWRQFLSSFKIH